MPFHTATRPLEISLTRRALLQALLAALAVLLRPLATHFTQIADELARLTCWRTSAPQLAAAG